MRTKIQIYEEVKSLLLAYSVEDEKPKFLLLAPAKHGRVVSALAQHAFHGNDNAIMIGNIQTAIHESVVFTYSEVESKHTDWVINKLIKEKLVTHLKGTYSPELTVFDPKKDLYKAYFNPFKFLPDGGDIVDAKSVLGNNFKTYGEDHPAAIAGVTDVDAYYFFLLNVNWKKVAEPLTPVVPKDIGGINVIATFEELLLLEDGSLRYIQDQKHISKFQVGSDQYRLVFTLFTKQQRLDNHGFSHQEIINALKDQRKASGHKHASHVANLEDLRNKINSKIKDTPYSIFLSSAENTIRIIKK